MPAEIRILDANFWECPTFVTRDVIEQNAVIERNIVCILRPKIWPIRVK
jgi:hypothetical protein